MKKLVILQLTLITLTSGCISTESPVDDVIEITLPTTALVGVVTTVVITSPPVTTAVVATTTPTVATTITTATGTTTATPTTTTTTGTTTTTPTTTTTTPTTTTTTTGMTTTTPTTTTGTTTTTTPTTTTSTTTTTPTSTSTTSTTSGVCVTTPTMWILYNGFCYWVSPTARQRSNAETDCGNKAAAAGLTDADLTSITNAAEAMFIQGLYMNMGGSGDYWIGLINTGTTISPPGTFVPAQYQWTDGMAVGYNDWQSGQPSDAGTANGRDTVVLFSMGSLMWDDQPATLSLQYVCKTPAP